MYRRKMKFLKLPIMNLKRYIALYICFILFLIVDSQSVTAMAEESNTKDNSIQSMAVQSSTAGELHAFYPTFATFSDQIQKYIDQVDSLSFAWSQIDAEDPGNLNTVKGKNGNKGFYYPNDYLQTVKYAKSKGKSIQLSIYMSGTDCTKLLPYEDKRKDMEKAILDSMQKDITQGDNIFYDGVVIDFEGLRDTDSNKSRVTYEGKQISTYLTQFLKELKAQLPVGKKLYVAVNSRLDYDGYNYKEILKTADRMILMAHDYEPLEKLTKDQVLQYTGYDALNPIYSPSPIQMVRKALTDVKNDASSSSDLSKVWLQIAFDSSQWQFDVNGPDAWTSLDGSSLSREGRQTPLYKAIKDRTDNADGKGKNITFGYNNELQSPWIQYYNSSDKSWNVILYEDSISIGSKIDLAKEFGLGGISVWSLGNLPDYNDSTGKAHHLNGWSSITDKMKTFHTQSSDSKKYVTFTDKAVEKAVRGKLGKSSGKITVADVNHIYRLQLSSGVKSLSDIKNLKNLEYLSAQNLNLKDIRALGNLTNLRVLYLQRNQISDISALKKLKRLQILSLNGNKISNLSTLSALTDLRELYIRENKIISIKSLAKLTKLLTLEAGTNSIKDITSLSGLKKLEHLSLDVNKISDVKAFKALTRLKYLNLAENKIINIQTLKSLTGLELLYLQRNSITDIKALSTLKNLKEVSLNGNKITDISPVSSLVNVEKLYLKDNKIKSVNPLKGLIHLKELYLKGNNISDYSPIKDLYTKLHFSCDFKI